MNDDPRQDAGTALAGPPGEGDLDAEIARAAKALGHPIRVRIMRILLAAEGCICGAIVDQLPVAQATVSQHLKVLKDAGLVRGEIDGARVCYCADRTALEHHRSLITLLCDGALTEPIEVTE